MLINRQTRRLLREASGVASSGKSMLRRSASRPVAIAAGLVLAGLAFVLAGLFVLGGSSERVPASLTQAGLPRVDLGDPSARRSVLDAQPSAGGPQSYAETLGRDEYDIIIDKIGVSAPVRTFGMDPATVDSPKPAPAVPEGPEGGQVVAWYDFTADPGAGGNAVFAGHVTWSRAPAVFYSLSSLQPGDTIRLRRRDGVLEIAYRVFSVFEVDPNDSDSVRVMDPVDGAVITLITCGGRYIPATPGQPGDYESRVVVRAIPYSMSRISS
jgi:LPXTG-site transpeptidase (sortase) family protein